MSTQQLAAKAMSLPLAERVSLAQELWQSIDVGLPESDETTALCAAVARDNELSSGAVVGRSHDEVMAAARRPLECD